MIGTTIAFIAITTVVLILTFPPIWLNLVFTFNYLPVENVPFLLGNSLPRYGVEWWFLATDICRVIPIALISIYLILPMYYSKVTSGIPWSIFFKTILGLGAFFELVKLITYLIFLIPGISSISNCYPTGCTGYNPVFIWMIIIAAFFTIYWFVWIFIFGDAIIEYWLFVYNKIKKN